MKQILILMGKNLFIQYVITLMEIVEIAKKVESNILNIMMKALHYVIQF